jgi:hypothetical protein
VGLSVTSLVLEIGALLSGPIAGVPAIILGWIALARRKPGRGMAIAGMTIGTVGTVIVSIFLLVAGAALARLHEENRRAEVWRNMGFTHTAMENWYITHLGTYPGPEVSWAPDAGAAGMSGHFPDDDAGISPSFPINPYTGKHYAPGTDLFYFPDYLAQGQREIVDGSLPGCPYQGLAAPEGMPGTILVLGWTKARDGEGRVEEYAVVGYGRKTNEPIHTDKWRDGTNVRTYRVRHN